MAGAPQTPIPTPKTAGQIITLEQALDLATRNNPTLQANQTLILQNKAQEITASFPAQSGSFAGLSGRS